MKEIGGMMLRLVSVLITVLGVVISIVALFFLYDTMMITEYDVSNKMKMLMWFFVLAEGVIFGIYGFYGAMNALDYDSEANKKCLIYGGVMMLFSIVDLVLVVMNFNIWALLSLIIVGVPILLSIIYVISTLLKIQGMKKSE